ncbi:hypothetical protein M9H77_28245 [Catharanthus roseus]|uniref:Uncharacterized protein n=2 Tax=Catharanthus roseus TaxID=4058 RepID=A0ACC0AG74_CATRO|nr:hypothetical protein M9H77_28245 [Catharanthus roseus]QTJ02271.1 CCT type transcription factor [Catharanthus roseus]
MSSCLTGGGRAYRLDLDIIKSPSTSWTSNSSSPSSTLSESSNSPIAAISTRKPRTPRKRPNQTYNEAAALLSTAYPKIFSPKHFTKLPCKFTKQNYPFSYESSAELFLPFQTIDNPSSFLIHHQLEKPNYPTIREKQQQVKSPGEIEINSKGDSSSLEIFDEFKQQEDFDAESILDEEIGEGIDSILGDPELVAVEEEPNNKAGFFCSSSSINSSSSHQLGTCYGYPVGLGFGVNFDFGFGIGMRNHNHNIRAFRNCDEGGELWSVNIGDITPKFNKQPQSEKKKKKKKVESVMKNSVSAIAAAKEEEEEFGVENQNSTLLLKLDYDKVLNAWSDRGCPFSDDSPTSEAAGGNDVHARLAKIDLFSESGGIREASVLRYKEKRRTRLFSKKIRYQVRKVNADRRPRMKGRFVRRSKSPESEQG